MRKTIGTLAFFALLVLGCENPSRNADENLILPDFKEIQVQYPETYSDNDGAADYFGKQVANPYHWLEMEGTQSSLRWLQAQRSLTDNYFKNIPYREAIRNRLAALWNYERRSAPVKAGAHFYFLKNDGLQNQEVLCRVRSLAGSVEVVIDPNAGPSAGQRALGQFSLSPDGSLLAYEMVDPRSGWSEIYIQGMDGAAARQDTLRWVKFSSLSWRRDGLFYSRYAAPQEGQPGLDLFHEVYFHKAGRPQSEDELVFADRQDGLRRAQARCTEDGRYLILTALDTSGGNALYFRDLNLDELGFTPIMESFEHEFTFVGNDENNLYVLTDHQAPNKRLLRISALAPGIRYWQEAIPQSAEGVLLEAHLFGGKIVAHYLQRASSQLKVFSLQGEEERAIPLPGIGMLQDFRGQQRSAEMYYQFSSPVQPGVLYRCDVRTGEQAPFWQAQSDFDSDAYVVEQVYVKSYDKAEVPMFIVHRKGLKLDGARPSLLCGYGAHGQPLLPGFDPTGYLLFPLILENGGVCAIAGVRGGGELGENWHAAGRLHRKQNSFDDFQAAAEYLIANKYTSPSKLAIHGVGAGGLLVGASLSQRSDLFAVALPVAGLFDMLRYQHLGAAADWRTEFGISEQQSDFDYLLAYSPQHQLSAMRYPATLIVAEAPGSGAAPAHSYKFAAALQANQQGGAPVLLRPGPGSSAAAGKLANRRIDEGADLLAFLFYNTKEGFRVVSKQE